MLIQLKSTKERAYTFRLLLTAVVLLWTIAPNLFAQQVVAKTNLLGWATTSPNLGVEVRLSERYTLNLHASYNAWNFSGNASLRHVLFQPEVRYWFCGAFQKHFVGAHLHAGDYNIGNLSFLPSLKEYQYRGQLYGAGLSYGYHHPLNARWALEASVGVGYAYLDYKKYFCQQCAEIRSYVKRHYVGPTKAAVSLIYLIH